MRRTDVSESTKHYSVMELPQLNDSNCDFVTTYLPALKNFNCFVRVKPAWLIIFVSFGGYLDFIGLDLAQGVVLTSGVDATVRSSLSVDTDAVKSPLKVSVSSPDEDGRIPREYDP